MGTFKLTFVSMSVKSTRPYTLVYKWIFHNMVYRSYEQTELPAMSEEVEDYSFEVNN